MILLDTHTLVWLDAGSDRLGAEARARIERTFVAKGRVAVSAITFWEIGTLVAKGRLTMGSDLPAWRRDLLGAGLEEIPVDGETALLSTGLEGFHADPADRLIVAAALGTSACLVTADARILDWEGPLDRLDAGR